jgi:hypothetical protein
MRSPRHSTSSTSRSQKLLTASLERQHLRILGEMVELSQHLSTVIPKGTWLCTLSNGSSSRRGEEWATLVFLRNLHRSLQRNRGLFTVLIYIPCPEVRQAQPDMPDTSRPASGR